MSLRGNDRDAAVAAGRAIRSRRSVVVGLVLAARCLGVPSAASAAASSYVALGDSYTSAFGVIPLAPTAPPECGQSTLNYPHLVALALTRDNALLKRSALANNAIFVDTFGPGKGHNACEPVAVRWIEPLIGSLTGVPVHPNATGEEHDAFALEKAMRRAGVR
jgi:hypothetical protein